MLEPSFFTFFVVRGGDTRGEKQKHFTLRAFSRRLLRSSRHFIVDCGGNTRGKKQRTLCSQTIRSAVFALRPSPFVSFVAALNKVRRLSVGIRAASSTEKDEKRQTKAATPRRKKFYVHIRSATCT